MENPISNQPASEFVDPREILRHLDMRPGKKVADFGCGPGFFTIPAAELVGEKGRVCAFDILPQIVNNIVGQAKLRGLANIEAKRVSLEREKGTGLPDASVDLVVIKNVLFQNRNKEAILKEAHRILQKDGEILVMEWNKKNLLVGPEESLRINPDDLSEMLIAKGFILKEKFDAGDFHYVIIANK